MLNPRLELTVIQDQIHELKCAMQVKQAEYRALHGQLILWQEKAVELERELEREANYYVARH
jgi:hypothetical protein